MSQISVRSKDNKTIHFGLDHVLGYFITMYGHDDEPEFETDSYGMMGKRMNGPEQVEWLKENISPKILDNYSENLRRILLDLDPASSYNYSRNKQTTII